MFIIICLKQTISQVQLFHFFLFYLNFHCMTSRFYINFICILKFQQIYYCLDKFGLRHQKIVQIGTLFSTLVRVLQVNCDKVWILQELYKLICNALSGPSIKRRRLRGQERLRLWFVFFWKSLSIPVFLYLLIIQLLYLLIFLYLAVSSQSNFKKEVIYSEKMHWERS